MEENKKKSKVLLFVIIGVVAALLIGFLIFFLIRGETGSIENLEKAINNTVDYGKNSGTIKASMDFSGDEQSTISISGAFKYQKNNDEYLFEIETNPSLFMQAIKTYGAIKDKNLIIYTNNQLLDMLAGTMSDEKIWLYNQTDLGEFEESIKMDEDVYSKDITFKDLGLENSIKYVGKKDGFNHYTLTIDKKLIESLKKKLPKDEMDQYSSMLDSFDEIEEVLEKGYSMNLYTKNNKLQKITIDFSDLMKESGIKKALITIEFLDFGKTKVNIPKEAKESKKTIEEYIQENTTYLEGHAFEDNDFDF